MPSHISNIHAVLFGTVPELTRGLHLCKQRQCWLPGGHTRTGAGSCCKGREPRLMLEPGPTENEHTAYSITSISCPLHAGTACYKPSASPRLRPSAPERRTLPFIPSCYNSSACSEQALYVHVRNMFKLHQLHTYIDVTFPASFGDAS